MIPHEFALVLASTSALLDEKQASGQLFENLKAFGSRLDVGDPGISSGWQNGNEGPKGVVARDLNGDGAPDLAASNLDGTLTVYLSKGELQVVMRPGLTIMSIVTQENWRPPIRREME